MFKITLAPQYLAQSNRRDLRTPKTPRPYRLIAVRCMTRIRRGISPEILMRIVCRTQMDYEPSAVNLFRSRI